MHSNTYKYLLKNQQILHPKRTRKHLKRRKKRRSVIPEHGYSKQRSNLLRKNIDRGHFELISVPRKFDFTANFDETAEVFVKLETLIRQGYPVYVDLEQVEDISVAALMYLLACLERFKGRKTEYNIRGNKPKNPEARKVFEESGFYSFLTNAPSLVRSAKVRPIYKGTKVLGEVAKDLCDFVHANFGWNRLNTKELYDALLEMMTNTVQHAKSFIESLNGSMWYVYAECGSSGDCITFCFLDLGEGIPATVRKSHIERIKEWVGGTSDAELVQSALEGKFRTQTNLGYRGKGLPTIYEYYKIGKIQDLAIISNLALIQNGNISNTRFRIAGTLFSWKVVC